MKSMVLVVAILIAAPAFAQTTPTPDPRRVVDNIFTGPYFLKLVGCDSSTWAAIHQAPDPTLTFRSYLKLLQTLTMLRRTG